MAETKIVVIYPRPTDVDAFEKVYVEEHLPLAMEKIKGVTKFAATKVVGTPDGSTPPFYRIAELYFPSMEALQESAASPGTQEAVAHAFKISTGGPPIILVAEQETTTL
ncbi:MAG: EthD family reductase [Acidobacteriota bacterium]